MRNFVRTTKQWRSFFIISCFLGLLAPTFFITAFAFLDPTIIIVQVPLLERYNNAVNGWNNKYRKEFSNLHYFVNVTVNSGSDPEPQKFTFIPSIYTEFIPIPSKNPLLPYKPLYFLCNISSAIPSINYDSPFVPSLTYTLYYFDLKTYTTQPIVTSSVDLITDISKNNYNPYFNNDNNNNNNSLNNNDITKLNNSNSESLLGPKKKFSGACYVLNHASVAQPCKYGDITFSNYTDTTVTKNNPIIFRDTIIKIKSNRDPFVFAGEITKGTFTFGMSRDTQQTLGTIFLIFGAALTFIFVCIVLMLLRKRVFMKLYRARNDLDGSSMSIEDLNDIPMHNMGGSSGNGNGEVNGRDGNSNVGLGISIGGGSSIIGNNMGVSSNSNSMSNSSLSGINNRSTQSSFTLDHSFSSTRERPLSMDRSLDSRVSLDSVIET